MTVWWHRKGYKKKKKKKRFVVALTGEIEEKRNKETLVPLILKYIKPGTTIYSDAWGAIADWGK